MLHHVLVVHHLLVLVIHPLLLVACLLISALRVVHHVLRLMRLHMRSLSGHMLTGPSVRPFATMYRVKLGSRRRRRRKSGLPLLCLCTQLLLLLCRITHSRELL